MVKKIKENKLYCGIVLVVFVLLFLNVWSGIDNDFFHIACSGKWIVEHKAIMYENEVFVLDGYKTIIQQWLYAVLLYGSYDLLGFTGVKLFTTMQFLILALVMYRLLQQLKVDKRTSVFVIAGSLFVMNYLNCRPQMISLILLCSQLIILEKYKNTGNAKVLYMLPLLTLAEINLHCTFWIFHFIFLLPYIVPLNKFFKGKLKIEDTTIAVKPLIIPMVLMAISLMINPYGIKAVTCLFYSSGISLLGISELQSVSVCSEQMLFLVMGIVLCVILYRIGKLTSTTLYFAFGTGILLVVAVRNTVFYSVAILYLMKEFLKNQNLNKFYNFLNFANKKQERIISAAIVISIGLLIGDKCLGLAESEDSDSATMPTKAVEYLVENEEDLSSVRMFTDFNSGSYFLWNGVGKIYFEPKTEPYIKEINGVKDIVTEYAFIMNYAIADDLDEFVKSYDFDYLYVTASFAALQVYLEGTPDYECVVTGSSYEGTIHFQDYDIAQYRLYKRVR
jgi:hypothetical protein